MEERLQGTKKEPETKVGNTVYARRLMSFLGSSQTPLSSGCSQLTPHPTRDRAGPLIQTALLVFSPCQLPDGCPLSSLPGPQQIKEGGRKVINGIPGPGYLHLAKRVGGESGGRGRSPFSPILETWCESSLYRRCSEPIRSGLLSQFKQRPSH